VYRINRMQQNMDDWKLKAQAVVKVKKKLDMFVSFCFFLCNH